MVILAIDIRKKSVTEVNPQPKLNYSVLCVNIHLLFKRHHLKWYSSCKAHSISKI